MSTRLPVNDALRRLVLDGVAAGARDSYGFAEWLVEVRQHFGSYGSLEASGELESAWMEAEAMWTRATGAEDREVRTEYQIREGLGAGG